MAVSSVVGVKRWVGHAALHILRNSSGKIQHVIKVYAFNWWNRNNCYRIVKVMKILFVSGFGPKKCKQQKLRNCRLHGQFMVMSNNEVMTLDPCTLC